MKQLWVFNLLKFLNLLEVELLTTGTRMLWLLKINALIGLIYDTKDKLKTRSRMNYDTMVPVPVIIMKASCFIVVQISAWNIIFSLHL
jgi:hypothetical protein